MRLRHAPPLRCLCVATLSALPAAQPATPKLSAELLEVGAGYAAKVAGWAVLAAGRSLDSVLAEELAPESAIEKVLAPLLRFEVDKANGRLTARVLTAARTVVWVPGLGTVLLPAGAKDTDLPALAPLPAPASADAPWPAGDALSAPDEGVDLDKLRAAVADAFAENDPKLPNLRTRAVVVVHRGRLIHEQYADGYHKDMPLPGWSMTKSVINALIGIRARLGKVDIDKPLGVPDWQHGDDTRAALTWRHLLQMSSGLEWRESYTDPTTDAPRMLFVERAAGVFARARALAFAAGSKFQYSSGTTNILCEALRAGFAERSEWLAFPQRELFAKLGMRSAVLEPDPSGTFVGSSFMLASARDWARFGLLYLQDGIWNGERVLPEGWVKETTTPAPSAARGRYGLHWWLNAGDATDPRQRSYPDLPRDLFAANGFQGQRLVIIPSRQLIVVRLGCTKVESRLSEAALLGRVLAALP